MNTVTVLLDKINEWKKEIDELDLQEPKSSQLMIFNDDPVAMAIAVHRRWKETPTSGNRWSELETAQVTPEDRETSAALRKYYADRIIMTMLGNNKISDFRRKLYGVVTDALSLNRNEIGLLYRLPYFYEEDLALDRVFGQTTAVEHQQPTTDRIQDCFTVIERVLRSRRAGDYTQLWLRGQRNSAAYMLTVKCDNPYHRLVTNLFNQPVTLSAWAYTKFHTGHYRGRGYYMLGDIELH